MRILSSFFVAIMFLSSQAQNVRINNKETEIEISDMENMSIKESLSITILNENGQQQGEFVGFEDDFHKITQLSMVVYNAAGKKVKKLGKAQARNWNINESYEVDNSEFVVIDPDFQDYPYTIELNYEQKASKGFIFLPGWMPREDFETEVKQASFKLTKPSDYQVNYLLENLEEPEVANDGDLETWSWTVNDLEAIPNQISRSQFNEEQPKVILSPLYFTLDGYPGSFESWQNFGDWYYDLNDMAYDFGEETKEFLESVNSDNIPVMVDELYEFMQKRSRYISIQLGIGGWQSLPTNYVDEKGFGDCKALSNYMKSMLDYKGVKSNFVLVYAGKDQLDIKTKIVSNQFNHVILAVPNDQDTIYLECTSQLLPTGYSGTFTDDRHALWVAKNASQLIKMPALTSEDNKLKSEGTLALDKYGNGKLELSKERGGLFFEDIQFLKSVSEDQREGYLYDQFDFKDFVVDDFSFEEPDGNEFFYTAHFSVLVNNFARNTSDKLLIPVHAQDDIADFLYFNKYKKIADVKRAFSLDDHMIIELPEGFNVSRLPDIPELHTEYGTYYCEINDLTDGRIELIRKVTIEKGSYMNEAFQGFSQFINGIKKADKSSLIITAGT